MQMFTLTEVAEQLGLVRATISNWVRPTVHDGSPPKMKAVKKGSRWYVSEAEMNRIRKKFVPEEVVIDGKPAVKLPAGLKHTVYALIDKDDFAKVLEKSKHCFLDGLGYVICGRVQKGILHRVILGTSGDLEIDHVNGDTLDNRKCNLRFANRCQNAQNRKITEHSSKYKGVKMNEAGRWEVGIRAFNKLMYLGTYSDEMQAARVYDAAAHKYHKKFARLNFSYPNGPPDLDAVKIKQRRPRGSGPKGVYFHTKSGKFLAHAKLHGKLKHIGLFRTEREAIKARDEFLELHPKFT